MISIAVSALAPRLGTLRHTNTQGDGGPFLCTAGKGCRSSIARLMELVRPHLRTSHTATLHTVLHTMLHT